MRVLTARNVHVIVDIIVYLISNCIKIYLRVIFWINRHHLLVIVSRTLIHLIKSVFGLLIIVHKIQIGDLLYHQRITHFLRNDLPLARIHLFGASAVSNLEIAFDPLADFRVLRHERLLVIVVRDARGRSEVSHQC